ncbi:mitochondrial fission ELM1 family protein [Luteimonas fraxinea]|uniref:Mitochondrial fission ELM1 family protein n=1 Tax=Luteimonas fraxinea TaxID=2901869 RepID=A0ABS8UFP0_9GAMM|nr:mitochondrial fission ELM1 family protein [Luteimonas fraxinea]MCD9098322.1 mitochondrial fission ELM1 family protein [Luteimonas fraxinea]MCD9127054.1 mitochondrial fission ELM1 family protein [Luteimonas fraxinea]UHH08744.1 mitochondrial fission ELM1 family protein [Luteimonas fraxinea]
MERRPGEERDCGRIWALSDGRAGNARQAEALAAALSPQIETLHLDPRAPWRWAAPRSLPFASNAFGSDYAARLDAAPAIAIGCGRQAALATRLAGQRGARTVQILDPRIDARHWDLVVVPEHDALRGDNVLVARGSLHPVDDAWLAAARDAHPALGALPGPRIAVLLGGDSRHGRFDVAAFNTLADRLDGIVARDGGSLLLTGSRRTSLAVRDALRARYAGRAGCVWADDPDGVNPYAGMLGWADRLVCSSDSVNMLSEACATRAPVFVFAPGLLDGAPQRFVDGLLADGRARPFEDALPAFDVTPLRETARIAAEVRTRLFAMR